MIDAISKCLTKCSEAVHASVGHYFATSAWNDSIAHAMGGPIALISLIGRGLISGLNTFISPKQTLTYRFVHWVSNKTVPTAPEYAKALATIGVKAAVNKLHLLLSSALGTVVWSAIAYALLAKFAGSLVLVKAITAILVSIAISPALPYIIGGAALVIIVVALINKYWCCDLKALSNATSDDYPKREQRNSFLEKSVDSTGQRIGRFKKIHIESVGSAYSHIDKATGSGYDSE